ncbi:MAG: UPF0261 family protein [Spirochaetes bacterium]|nr:UPF0261 family protein [Spirochaetota bacterium]
MKRVYVVGTFDTKAEELSFVAERIRSAGAEPLRVDVSSRQHNSPVDVSNVTVAAHHPEKPGALGDIDDRGSAIAYMSEALGAFLLTRTDLAGIIAVGGSGNTSLVTAAMRRLPIGLPKVMVSTVASGNVAPYVGPNDICMMYSVTDIAGLNRISRRVLANGAHAIAGMASFGGDTSLSAAAGGERPPVAMSMLGITTPCVTRIRHSLEGEYDPIVFHATGAGGRAMEKLIRESAIGHVIDVTTSEIADHLVGGTMSAGEERLDSIVERGLPYVGSVGGMDIVVFGRPESVPAQFADRHLHQHNPQITLMRTTAEENRRIGRWIAEKLNRMTGSVRFLLPERGVSILAGEGAPFHDPEADEALFAAIETGVHASKQRRVERIPAALNDDAFADAVVAAFAELSPAPR